MPSGSVSFTVAATWFCTLNHHKQPLKGRRKECVIPILAVLIILHLQLAYNFC